MQRKNISSGTRWESIVGYSQAVRVGDFVFISGTTATNKDGDIIGLDNPYLQTIQIIKISKVHYKSQALVLKMLFELEFI